MSLLNLQHKLKYLSLQCWCINIKFKRGLQYPLLNLCLHCSSSPGDSGFRRDHAQPGHVRGDCSGRRAWWGARESGAWDVPAAAAWPGDEFLQPGSRHHWYRPQNCYKLHTAFWNWKHLNPYRKISCHVHFHVNVILKSALTWKAFLTFPCQLQMGVFLTQASLLLFQVSTPWPTMSRSCILSVTRTGTQRLSSTGNSSWSALNSTAATSAMTSRSRYDWAPFHLRHILVTYSQQRNVI